ncbi:VOC family protein [Humibacter sp.]|jgi:hypothetical protein|uniref:VOC family protein n=1 Tax=Humibacter sp. TaxID=1940291 RepID=UPI002B8D5B7A|nr:VOC family protein [Humibacter sp.]HVX07015.1 VOC family protein [Humibacter sp.]
MPDRRGTLAVAAVSLDCADHGALAGFYAELLGGSILWQTPAAAAVRAGSVTLIAQRVEPYERPRWPGTAIVHLDISGPDLDLPAQAEFAVACGATVAPVQPDPRWVVLLDPAGHPFCLTPFTP